MYSRDSYVKLPFPPFVKETEIDYGAIYTPEVYLNVYGDNMCFEWDFDDNVYQERYIDIRSTPDSSEQAADVIMVSMAIEYLVQLSNKLSDEYKMRVGRKKMDIWELLEYPNEEVEFTDAKLAAYGSKVRYNQYRNKLAKLLETYKRRFLKFCSKFKSEPKVDMSFKLDVHLTLSEDKGLEIRLGDFKVERNLNL